MICQPTDQWILYQLCELYLIWPKFLTSICLPSVVWIIFPQSERCESPERGNRTGKDTPCAAYRADNARSSQLQFLMNICHCKLCHHFIFEFQLERGLAFCRFSFCIDVRIPRVSWAQRRCNGKPALVRFGRTEFPMMHVVWLQWCSYTHAHTHTHIYIYIYKSYVLILQWQSAWSLL